jgi:hypothetical protein
VRDWRTVKMLFEQICARYAGSYARVTRWVRAYRAEQDATPRRATFVPMNFELGDAFRLVCGDQCGQNVNIHMTAARIQPQVEQLEYERTRRPKGNAGSTPPPSLDI